MLHDFASQHVAVNVHIDFCSRYAFVPQHTLNGPKVGPSFEQMRSKGVAEGMRTDIFLNANCLCLLFNQMKNHNTPNAIPPTR